MKHVKYLSDLTTDSYFQTNGPTSVGAKLEDKLALAKKMAEKIAMKNNQKGAIQQSTESYLSGKGGSGGQPTLTAKTVADHLAKRLNAKLNYQPTEESTDSGMHSQFIRQKF